MKYVQYILGFIIVNSIATVFASSYEVEHNYLDSNQDVIKKCLSKTSYPLTDQVLKNYKIVINNKSYKIHLNDSIINELDNSKDKTKDMMEKTLANLSKLKLPSTFQGFILSISKNDISYTPILNRPFR